MPTFSMKSLNDIRDLAQRKWLAYSGEKTRLEGGHRNLNKEELLCLAYYEASLEYINREAQLNGQAEWLRPHINNLQDY